MKNHETIRVRSATSNDLAAVQSIGRETYLDHFSSLWSEKGLEQFLQRDFSTQTLRKSLNSPLEHSWLLAEDSRSLIVGYAKINWNRPNPISKAHGAELQKIYFRSSATGRGFGMKLVEFVGRASIERAQSNVWLEVLKTNTRAQRLYANCGFQRSGEIPFSTDITDIGMVIMVRELVSKYSFE